MKVRDKIKQARECLASVGCEADAETILREIARQGSGPRFILAADQDATELYWLHLSPNPWGTMRLFLAHVERELPGAFHWLIGFEKEPVELGTEPTVREILSLFEWGKESKEGGGHEE